eukprot:CAMPEP_0176095756 /NCGR_PEP_ID=MMETSP0120_2-20121206/47999_1 /TAXON_ID=160619 /ORGANISM="Kryptoperidinium foliaceum, Strain CCMP 1326" /LENGTH=109 /DNA_ID=CAMNT_0017429731 /DNA_START=96 /DNA_END=422 /DNA_ORIENTATION=-
MAPKWGHSTPSDRPPSRKQPASPLAIACTPPTRCGRVRGDDEAGNPQCLRRSCDSSARSATRAATRRQHHGAAKATAAASPIQQHLRATTVRATLPRIREAVAALPWDV